MKYSDVGEDECVLCVGTKSDNTFVQQMRSDYENIRDRIVGYKKSFSEITANDLPVFLSNCI